MRHSTVLPEGEAKTAYGLPRQKKKIGTLPPAIGNNRDSSLIHAETLQSCKRETRKVGGHHQQAIDITSLAASPIQCSIESAISRFQQRMRTGAPGDRDYARICCNNGCRRGRSPEHKYSP